jgi:predicted O-methyltransferase YrrM
MDFERITRRLEVSSLPPAVLLSRAHFPSRECKDSAALNDPNFLNFYYYLGEVSNHPRVLEVGFSNGLAAMCFLQSAKTKKYVAYSETPSGLFEKKNVLEVYKGDFETRNGEIGDEVWDLILVTEVVKDGKLMPLLEKLWKQLAVEGLLVVDYIESGNQSFSTFCKVHNREPKTFATRYGTGILVR